ncbi:MAG: hypothetical protein AAF267_01525 [Deinococcota bacterium]
MGSATRKLRRAIEKKREIKLEAEGVPTLTGKYKPVKFGQLLREAGAVDSPYLKFFDGSLVGDERTEAIPTLSDDSEAFEEYRLIGSRVDEAYLVLGVKELFDEDGDVYKVQFSDESDDECVTMPELKELYGSDVIQDIYYRIFELSNGRPHPHATLKKPNPVVAKRFPESDGDHPPDVQSVRSKPN